MRYSMMVNGFLVEMEQDGPLWVLTVKGTCFGGHYSEEEALRRVPAIIAMLKLAA